MIISSRTPEGEPASCPLCMAQVMIEPSVIIGDATCPRCGQLLWFIQFSDRTQLFDTENSTTEKDRAIKIVATQLGMDPQKVANHPTLLADLGADSLDAVELVMELEEEFFPQ